MINSSSFFDLLKFQTQHKSIPQFQVLFLCVINFKNPEILNLKFNFLFRVLNHSLKLLIKIHLGLFNSLEKNSN